MGNPMTGGDHLGGITDMVTPERRRELERNEPDQLTPEELALGFHFCWEFDELIVGPPESGESEPCPCGVEGARRPKEEPSGVEVVF